LTSALTGHEEDTSCNVPFLLSRCQIQKKHVKNILGIQLLPYEQFFASAGGQRLTELGRTSDQRCAVSNDHGSLKRVSSCCWTTRQTCVLTWRSIMLRLCSALVLVSILAGTCFASRSDQVAELSLDMLQEGTPGHVPELI